MPKPWEILWSSDPIPTEEGDKYKIYCSDGHVRIVHINPYNWNPCKSLYQILLAIEEEWIPDWKTKEGEELRVSEMADRHYRNAIAFVEWRLKTYPSDHKKHLVSRFWLGVLQTDPRFGQG